MKTILIGIDGGASKTKLLAADENLNVIAEGTGGPSNYLAIGLDKAIDNLTDLICKAFAGISLENAIVNLAIGTAGAGRKDDVEKLTKALGDSLKGANIPFKYLVITSDARIALEGVFEGKAGVIVNCGTGSFVYGKDELGNIHRVGGFGRLIGDEGSGYSIGRQGLNLISKMMDGRLQRSLLYDEFVRQSGINDAVNLINGVYKGGLDIPAVAPLVVSCAEKDELCKEILEKEVDEILLHMRLLDQKAKVNDVNVVFVGSLIDSENYYSRLMREKICEDFPGAKIVPPANTPAYGALLLSRKMLSN